MALATMLRNVLSQPITSLHQEMSCGYAETPQENLDGIEASGLRDGTAPRCHDGCHWREKSEGNQSSRTVSILRESTRLRFCGIKVGLNVIHIFCGRGKLELSDVNPWSPPQGQSLMISTHFGRLYGPRSSV